MTTEQIFGILKIGVTKDEGIIQSAYRMELVNNHPEDNPEGFKLLREAYEAALEYARSTDEPAEEDYGDTPFGHFVNELKTIYNTFSKRTDTECWREFLSQDIFSDLEYAEQVKEYLFTYLMDNFRLTNDIYRLLNEKYDIVENANEYMEFLPQGFVTYMINCINDINNENEFAFEWFKGDDRADYDSFISSLFEVENQVYTGDFNDIDSKIAKMDALNIYHPYFELVKGYAEVNKGMNDEAYNRAKKLVETEEYKYSIKNQSCGGELLWLSGHRDEALTVFKRMDDDGVDSSIVKKYIGIAALEDNNFRDAVIYLSSFANSEDEEMSAMLEKADYGFIEECESYLSGHPNEPIEDINSVDALVYAYMRRNRNEEAIKFLTGNEMYEEKLFTYHKTLSTLYAMTQNFDKALHENGKWINVLENRKKEALSKTEELKCNADDENVSDDEKENLEYELMNESHMINACNYELSAAYSYKGKLIVNQSFSVRESKKAAFLERAMTAFEKADEFVEGECDPKVNMANLAMMQEEYIKAYEISREAAELDSEYFPALAVKLDAAYETANAQDVIDLFYQITDIYPEYIRGYEYAALVFLEYNQETDAENILERAKEQGIESFGLNVLELKKNYMQEKAAENETGNKKIESKVDSEYLNLIQNIIENQDEKTMQPADKRFLAELYYMKSDIALKDYAVNDHTIAEIKEPALKAAALCHSRRYIYQAADAYRMNRDYKKSLEMLERFEKMCEPAAGVYLDMIECLDFTNQWARATMTMKKAIDASGDNPNIYKWLGMINDNHARRLLDRGCHYDVMKYWKLYLEKKPDMALLCHLKIADAALVVDEWDIAIEHIKAALEEDFEAAKAADTQNDLDIDSREEIYTKLIRTYIYKRDFDLALQYTDFLSKKKNKCYYLYHFKGLIYEKLKDYNNAIYWYSEGIKNCDGDDRFDIADSLKLLYKRCKMYKEAKSVLDNVQKKTYSEKAYVYNKIKLERAMAKTDKERKAVLKELRSAMNKYETAELREEMMDMQIYDFGNIEHFYDAKLKRLSEKFESGIRSYYENIGSIAEALALAWDIKDTEKVKELAESFNFGLEQFYGYDNRRKPIEHYLADYSDGLENMCKVIIYYVCTGQLDKADELIKDFETKDLCSFCTISICTERFQALGLYYEAKGNEKLAYEYYKAAVDNGIMDSFANYKIAKAGL